MVHRANTVVGKHADVGCTASCLQAACSQKRCLAELLLASLAERIFEPLGIVDIGFTMSVSMRSRRPTIHDRSLGGKLAPLANLVLQQPPEMDMGGHGLRAAVGEYMKFIRMLLNDGADANGRMPKADTVAQMVRNGLPKGVNGEGWTFQVNEEHTPTGRPGGSLMWAGIANLFYWVDRKTGVGGYWGSQILPFHDVASYAGFVEFEIALCSNLRTPSPRLSRWAPGRQEAAVGRWIEQVWCPQTLPSRTPAHPVLRSRRRQRGGHLARNGRPAAPRARPCARP